MSEVDNVCDVILGFEAGGVDIITLGDGGWRATVSALWESPIESTCMYPKHRDLIWKIDAGKRSRQTHNRGPQSHYLAIWGSLSQD